MFKQTALTSVDSYKLGHADQYPAGTTKVYSNFTPRSEAHFNVPDQYKDGHISWFGLQGFLQEMQEIWDSTFFNLTEYEFQAELKDIAEIYAPFCGPNGFNLQRLTDLYNLGYLPLCIKALPEGSRVPIGVPVLTITNTVDEFYWLPNFMETWMSAELWKSSTSASTAFVYRKIIERYADITGGSKEFIDWQGHDFSSRGMSGIADAAKSGAGHLLYFTGTDNISAVKYIRDVYQGKNTFIGGSVPATEHSVMCAGGKETEIETFRRLLKTYPSGIISIVSDTWDFWNVITNIAAELKEEILARTPDEFGNAKTVFRPDSGDPVKIITGYKVVGENQLRSSHYNVYDEGYEVVRTEDGRYFILEAVYNKYDGDFDRFSFTKEISEAEAKGAIECLAEIFSTTTNAKGYKTLNPRVGLIYGDSITPGRAEQILSRLQEKGFASDNVVFGIGSYTFQYATRDSLGFAMKATYVEINGEGMEIFKSPKTDNGTKKSAKGLLRVIKEQNSYRLEDGISKDKETTEALQTVYMNGALVSDSSYENIRALARSYL